MAFNLYGTSFTLHCRESFIKVTFVVRQDNAIVGYRNQIRHTHQYPSFIFRPIIQYKTVHTCNVVNWQPNVILELTYKAVQL